MLIYPDSSDLINLCRGRAGINIDDLAFRLSEKSHIIVFSMETLVEVAAPLKDDRSLEVRRDLNRLGDLPHKFVNEGRIYEMELRESIRAFEEDREYESGAVTPFAPRIDEAIDIYGASLYMIQRGMPVSTKMIVNLRMSEAIAYLWKRDPHIFDVQRRREQQWIQLVASDRALSSPPTLRDHFVTMMSRALALRHIPPPSKGVDKFAAWVYHSPRRCPGIRLTYETHHRFRRDRGARAEASDIIDLARCISVPYVDFFVTDQAMMNYCRQAAKEISHPYPQLLGDFQAVLHYLGIDSAIVSRIKDPT